MRILVLSWFLPPYVGGAENIAAAEIRSLRTRGHQVTVVTGPKPRAADHPGTAASISSIGPGPVVRVAELHPSLDDAANEATVRLAIERLMSETPFDLLYGHMLTYPWAPRRSAAIIGAATRAGVPVASAELGGDPERDAPQCLKLMSSVNLLVCCSAYVRDRLARLAANTDPEVAMPKMTVVHPEVVPADVFLPDLPSGIETRRNLGLNPEDFVVFFPSRFFDINGTLSTRKQPLLALEAFAVLARTVPAARLLAILPPGFLGPDDEREARRHVAATVETAGIATQVRFVDQRVAQVDMVQYYRAADVTLVPSCEGFGLVYLESMACAVPVVGVADGAGIEVVGEDAGVFVPTGPEVAARLGEAMARLYFDAGQRAGTGAAGRHRYWSTFAGQGWAEELERTLTSVT